jgi:hypothetical protein
MFKLGFVSFQKNPFCRFLNDVKGGQSRMFFPERDFPRRFSGQSDLFISAAKSSLTKHFNNSRQASDSQSLIDSSIIVSPDIRIQVQWYPEEESRLKNNG